MGPVLAALWKIIFLAVFCLAKAAMEPSATAETLGEMRAALPDTLNGDAGKATVLQRMNDINSGGNTYLVTVVTSAPKKSAVTTAQENTANFPRPTMSITVFGNTTSADRYSTIVNEPGGTIAVPGVPSVAFEEVTKNFLQNIINSTSTENPYTIHTTVSGPGGATAPNGDPTTAIENATKFHEESSASPPVENPATTTSISTENPVRNITGKTTTQGQDNTVDMVTSSENVPDDLPDITEGNPSCYSECIIVPPWATVLLCLGTAFFIFALVGFVFLLPYCKKFRRPSAASSSSSPRYSV